MSRGRPQKVADLIQRELSDLLRREVRDPHVGMVTLTSVDVSPDLSHAKVFFTLLNTEKKDDTARALRRAAGFLRSQLASRLTIRVAPSLTFEFDASIDRGVRISKLIDDAVADDLKHSR